MRLGGVGCLRAGYRGCTWCLCWFSRGSSTSWLGDELSWRRGGVSDDSFCLLRHMHTRKKRQAMTSGMAMLGIRMYRISFFRFSGGSAETHRVHSASITFTRFHETVLECV